jgi:hypothetical protein
MRISRLLGVALAIGLVSVASAARAGDLLQPKTVIISAENLSELTVVSISNGGNGGTYFALLGNPASPAPYDIPRLAVDIFVTDRVTVGGALTITRFAPDRGSNETIFTISPRVGFMFPLTANIGLWPRGGFTYYNDDNAGLTVSGFALNLEGMFVFKLIDHFAIIAGPVIDIGLTGSVSENGISADERISAFGLRAGLLTWL